MSVLYGVNEDSYVDVSSTLRGAKNYATRNGYKKVFERVNGGYIVTLVSEKIGKKWVNVS